MAKLTDEMLMAYADGQLDPAVTEEVEAMLARDAEAMRKVEALRRSMDLARMIMERPLRAPVPQPLIETVLGTAVSESKVVSLGQRWRPRSAAGWALPIAAALALTIGLTAYLGGDRSVDQDMAVALGPLDPASPLSVVLESTGSGQGVTLPGGSDTALILATYRDSGGRPCREFEVLGNEAHPIEIGIACREGGGRWTIVGAAEVPADLSANGTFLPAGDQSNDPLQAVLKAIGAGAALSPAEESALLADNWRKPAAN
jgi:hypothetical protein